MRRAAAAAAQGRLPAGGVGWHKVAEACWVHVHDC